MALNLTTWTSDIIICTNGEPADLDLPGVLRQARRAEHPGDRVSDQLRRPQRLARALAHLRERPGARHRQDLLRHRPVSGRRSRCAAAAASATRAATSSWTSPITPRCATASPRATSCPVRSSPSPRRRDGAIAALAIHKSLVPAARKLEKLESRRGLTARGGARRYQRSLIARACFSRIRSRSTSRSPSSAARVTICHTCTTRAHRLPLDADDHVALLQPRLVRRRADRHVVDQHARLQAETPLQSIGDRHELRAGHARRRELERARQRQDDRRRRCRGHRRRDGRRHVRGTHRRGRRERRQRRDVGRRRVEPRLARVADLLARGGCLMRDGASATTTGSSLMRPSRRTRIVTVEFGRRSRVIEMSAPRTSRPS